MATRSTYQECSRCIMDNAADPQIHFDDSGVCSYCHQYENQLKKKLVYLDKGRSALDEIVAKIKADRKGEYDCLIGLSGGVDSTYVAYLVKELGLNPLAVHLDNGWNSELAVINIQNTLDKLGIDLYTHVINWKEFRDMQRAYIMAGVVDIEALTDHAISAILFRLSREFNIKYILSGENIETEGMLPSSWVHMKLDHINIKAIHDHFGRMPRQTYPLISYYDYLFNQRVRGISYVPILNYLPYNKAEVKQLIQEKLSWRDYGGKHYESIFTRFYQAYILPVKFGIDKRRSHLSTLICAGQISRAEALEEISQPTYPPDLLADDKSYVLKKLQLETAEFDALMQAAPVPHTNFPSIVNRTSWASKLKQQVRRIFPFLRRSA